MKWLTIAQAAEYTGYSTRSLERYVAAGRLPAYVAGRTLRFKTEDLDALFTRVLVP
jgi:excisionase family DNA binding protein